MKTKFLLSSIGLIILTSMTYCAIETKNKKNTSVGETDFVSLLDKKIDSEEVKKFISNYGSKEIESSAKYPHWMFTNDGLEIAVSTENTVHAIFLVKKSYIYKNTYTGYIPYELKMTDTRIEVEKKLGTGEIVKTYGNVQICWKNKNIQIGFATRDKSDMNAVVEQIQFRTW